MNLVENIQANQRTSKEMKEKILEFLDVLLTNIKDALKFFLLMFVSGIVMSLIVIIIRWILSLLIPGFSIF